MPSGRTAPAPTPVTRQPAATPAASSSTGRLRPTTRSAGSACWSTPSWALAPASGLHLPTARWTNGSGSCRNGGSKERRGASPLFSKKKVPGGRVVRDAARLRDSGTRRPSPGLVGRGAGRYGPVPRTARAGAHPVSCAGGRGFRPRPRRRVHRSVGAGPHALPPPAGHRVAGRRGSSLPGHRRLRAVDGAREQRALRPALADAGRARPPRGLSAPGVRRAPRPGHEERRRHPDARRDHRVGPRPVGDVPVMAYPNAEEYVRAVQQPEQVFQVTALRRAVFDVHPLFGIPMPASGSAAVVFRARVEGTDSALRFFIREDASSRERYAALGESFREHRMEDCVASAAWVDDAIAVNGSTWPMVQMQWVEGRTLDAYVGYLAATANVEALSQLAGIWRSLVGRLQNADFAHGDLQHGNVLVDSSSSLRLVDFDGSWVPALRDGPPPNETGNPNYQRPGREWGCYMDTFPGLVIYTALLALSRRPESWERLHNGENLLFSRQDFSPPFRTPAWELVAGIGDPEVDHAAQRLIQACASDWRAQDTRAALPGTPPVAGPPPRPPQQAPARYGPPARPSPAWGSPPGPVP